MSVDVDVVVSGGGPAGLSCAAQFSRLGLRVILAERRDLPQRKCCGEFLHPTAVWELNRLGIRPAPALLNRIDRVYLSAGSRTGQFQLNPGSRSIPRCSLSNLLLAAATGAGVEIMTGAPVKDCVVHPKCVDIRVGKSRISARLLILAEGSASSNATSLGLTRRASIRTYGFSTQLNLDLSGYVSLGAIGDGYVGLCDLGSGRANLAGILRAPAYRRIRPDQDGWMDRLKLELPAWSDWLGSEPGEVSFQAPVCAAEASWPGRFENVWLVGDSAGMSETAFGDGIARSLRQATLAVSAFERRRGDLKNAQRDYGAALKRDAHRPVRLPLAFAGAALRRPNLTRGLVTLMRPMVQTLCRLATAAQSPSPA